MILRLAALAAIAIAFGLAPVCAQAAPLPQTIAAPAPFPLVTRTILETEFVAPGIVRGEYRLMTSNGPLHVSVVAANLHDPTVHLDAVLADDRMISPGEPISSMARRTGAVAGINADYFDIGQTNQPLGILVQHGTMLNPPNGRAMLSVSENGAVAFQEGMHPVLDGVVTALGGGPLLVAGGLPFADPSPPAPEETNLRFPVAGIATETDGTLLLIAVDGRRPRFSIGLTRAELGALMIALGATDGMATDSGGSATLVARILGERDPSVLNVPSDGKERPVADGLFLYSTAPVGPPARLVVRPSTIRALPAVQVALQEAITDEAGHLLQTLPPSTLTTPAVAGSRTIAVRGGGLEASIPVEVVDRIERLSIDPARPNPDPDANVALHAFAFDGEDDGIALGDRVIWSTSSGTIAGGVLQTQHDAIVTARAANARAQILVRVGRKPVPAPLFAEGAAGRWRFTTIPQNGPGSLAFDPGCRCLTLQFDFTGKERAAYAAQDVALPDAAVGLALDVRGDSSRTGLRATLIDRTGRMERLTLARAVDWSGWRRLEAPIPPELAPPIRLVSLYAVGTLGDAPVHAAGTLAFRDAAFIVAGTP